MAPITGDLPGAEDFAGDEFSNNLFSDLAPLLTLFGEQVTKQFLSMSLGWADNVLLSMGPLGIITTIVSAIRVGRVKKLKAIIGRARESQSTAEQELLSSTSSNVCELWSGREVVRVMGNLSKMKNLIIRDDGEVFDLKSAVVGGVMVPRSQPDEISKRHGIGLTNNSMLNRDAPKFYALLATLSHTAPNLALNVKNSCASPQEMWSWAVVGASLQLIALVIPGLTTFYWMWAYQPGIPIVGYGYPCFIVGTLLVIGGIAACGHVIEGVTTEYEFVRRRDMDNKPVAQVKLLRIQKACVLGDQYFPSCAIFNSEDDQRLRISQLNDQDYSSFAAVASLVTVAGFIVQFVGLRALHWSATIIQLGVTLIMTAIRAWSRRGLASSPDVRNLPEGHELAWLAFHLAKQTQSGGNANESRQRETDQNQRLDLHGLSIAHHGDWWSPILRSPVWAGPQRLAEDICWELIVGYDSFFSIAVQDCTTAVQELAESANPPESRTFTNPRSLTQYLGISNHDMWAIQQLCPPIRPAEPLRVSLCVGENTNEDVYLLKYARARWFVEEKSETVEASNAFCSVIERVMNIVSSGDAFSWKGNAIRMHEAAAISWCFNISVGRVDEYHYSRRLQNKVCFTLERPGVDGHQRHPTDWRLSSRDSILGAISLWMYTLSRRRTALAVLDKAGPLIQSRSGYAADTGVFARIVATQEKPSSANLADLLRAWIGEIVYRTPRPDGFHDTIRTVNTRRSVWFFGMFLSSLSNHRQFPDATREDRRPHGTEVGVASTEGKNDGSQERTEELFIPTRADTSLVIHCAQELFSLFMLAIASETKSVRGKTTELPEGVRGTEPGSRFTYRHWENSVFSMIADEVVSGGLARDVTEAYTLIVPAFAKYDVLPTKSVARDAISIFT
ncbi:hypothetical protein DL770_008705 [Monosporascus sp. CRB-9-2]|nr:hypothetical protein DL770_008705 [Monosporascus sp. CRB-9-2]